MIMSHFLVTSVPITKQMFNKDFLMELNLMDNGTITRTVIQQEEVVGVVENVVRGVISAWDIKNCMCLRTHRWVSTVGNFHDELQGQASICALSWNDTQSGSNHYLYLSRMMSGSNLHQYQIHTQGRKVSQVKFLVLSASSSVPEGGDCNRKTRTCFPPLALHGVLAKVEQSEFQAFWFLKPLQTLWVNYCLSQKSRSFLVCYQRMAISPTLMWVCILVPRLRASASC